MLGSGFVTSKSAIVTGASGFLGTAMTSLLLSHGYEVITIDRSSSPLFTGIYSIVGNLNTLDLFSCVPVRNYSACFHFAGSSSVPASFDHPLKDFISIAPATLNLIFFLSKRHPDCRLFVGSSAAVYGNPPSLPIRETFPLAPISPYGIHKTLVENLCAHYSRLLCFPISILRIFSAYGVGQTKQLLWDTSKKLYEASLLGLDSIRMWGTGEETRDFIHATDVARAALCLAECQSNHLFEVLNVAGGTQVKIAELVEDLCLSWGYAISPIFGGEVRIGDPVQWCADISNLNKYGYMPSIILDDGLRDYVVWAKNILSNR